MSRTIYIQCRLTRAGFAHERIFLIDAPGGGEYRGLAFIGHCRTAAGKPLPPGEPQPGQTMDGLLEARVVEEPVVGTWTVQVPDGELCEISQDIISSKENHVPLGS